MLVSVHKPNLGNISSLSTDEPNPFHVVQISDNHTGGNVDLYIDADWSQWDKIVEQVTDYRQVAAVRALGSEHGHSAGTWAIDGNTTVETARAILQGIEDGDPAVMDMQPSPLSGEWADGASAEDVYRIAGIATFDEYGDPIGGSDMLLVEYEESYSTAYWAEVSRAATAIAGNAESVDA